MLTIDCGTYPQPTSSVYNWINSNRTLTLQKTSAQHGGDQHSLMINLYAWRRARTCCVAIIRGVCPCPFLLITSPPASSTAFITSRLPPNAAPCTRKFPNESLTDTDDPALRRRRTTFGGNKMTETQVAANDEDERSTDWCLGGLCGHDAERSGLRNGRPATVQQARWLGRNTAVVVDFGFESKNIPLLR